MKTYIVYKEKIDGYTDVFETVKSVEKVAAVHVSQLKNEVVLLSEYIEKMRNVLEYLNVFYGQQKHKFQIKQNKGKRVLIFLSGEKGLVGSLWLEMVHYLRDHISNYNTLIVVGKKGNKILEENGFKIEKAFTQAADIPSLENIKDILQYVFQKYLNKTYKSVDLLYPKTITFTFQKVQIDHFLPFKSASYASSSQPTGIPIFEPSKGKVFDYLITKWISNYFLMAFMELKRSEFTSRAVAMEQAGVKTKEIIQDLTLEFSKERHRSLTQKQLESFVAHKMT